MEGIPDIEPIKQRFAEIDGLMAQPDFFQDSEQAIRQSREHQRLSNLIKLYTSLETLEKHFAESEVLVNDTHIHRLAQRWGLTRGPGVVQTERDLKRLFPEETWHSLHLQFIYYGREHCSARGCDGTVCEICRTCYPHRKKPFRNKKS